MALLRVTEYGGYANGRPFSPGIPVGGPIQSQTITVGSTVSTFNLSSATRLIFIDADGGVFVAIGSSVSTTGVTPGSSGSVVGSTSGPAQRIPANQPPFPIYVQPGAKLFAVST